MGWHSTSKSQNNLKEVFPPETEPVRHIIPHTFEHCDYIIEVVWTVFGSRRVCIRESDDPAVSYIANWCAGPVEEDCQKLLGLAKNWIEKGTPKFPFQSDPKPYFKDPDFCQKMDALGFEPFHFELRETRPILLGQ